MSRDGNEPNTGSNKPKQQGGSLLPFLDHDFKVYHTTEWYQWELIVQMLANSATKLNAANNVGTKTKALLIKLLAVHGKDNSNVFAKTRRRLEIEKNSKSTEDLIAYETKDR
eukprot:10981291-Ditylum_brightwellii.AAC.1